MTPNTETRRVAVLVERRKGVTPWQEWVWQAVEVLEAVPDLPPWSVMRTEGSTTLWFAGAAEVALHPTDTDNYRHNLGSGQPRLWVILRQIETEPGLALHVATADAGEAHNYADSGTDLMEALPLPTGLTAWVEDFCERHHQVREFRKRKRDAKA